MGGSESRCPEKYLKNGGSPFLRVTVHSQTLWLKPPPSAQTLLSPSTLLRHNCRMPGLYSYMFHSAYCARPQTPPLRILWSKPTPTHRERASWHPSKISLIFRTFAKAELGILQQNPNDSLFLTWHPSKPRNSHACLLTAKISKNTAFAPAHTTTWRPSTKTQCFALFVKTNLGALHESLNVLQLINLSTSTKPNIQRPALNIHRAKSPQPAPKPMRSAKNNIKKSLRSPRLCASLSPSAQTLLSPSTLSRPAGRAMAGAVYSVLDLTSS